MLSQFSVLARLFSIRDLKTIGFALSVFIKNVAFLILIMFRREMHHLNKIMDDDLNQFAGCVVVHEETTSTCVPVIVGVHSDIISSNS